MAKEFWSNSRFSQKARSLDDFGPASRLVTAVITSTSWSDIASKLNTDLALACAALERAERSEGDREMMRRTAAVNAGCVGSTRNPVGLGFMEEMEGEDEESRENGIIDSTGPPLLQAITGRPQIIPSTGPIPKCSFVGV